MVENIVAGKEMEEALEVALGKGDSGNGHTVDIRHCRNKHGVDVMDRKRTSVCRNEPIVVDAPPDIAVDDVITDAVSEGKSSGKDRSNIGLDTEAPVFARSCASHATGDLELVGQGKSSAVEKSSEANVAGKLVSPVLNKESEDAVRSRASFVLRPCVECSDLFALCSHNQKPRAEKGDLLPRRAGNQKTQMDTLLKL